MKTVKLLLLFPLLLNFYLANAQYVGQINNASTLYNPSFVGSKNALRVASGVATNGPAYTTTFLALDAPIKKISGAIGISYLNSFTNNNMSNNYMFDPNFYKADIIKFHSSLSQFNISYAQIFTKRNNDNNEILSIRPSLTFSTNIINTIGNDSLINNSSNVRLIPSLLITNKKYFIGLKYSSSYIINYGFQGLVLKRFNHLNLLAGYTFQKPESKFSFTPIIELQFGNLKGKNPTTTSDYLKLFSNVNLNFKYGKVLWGLNGLLPMVGYQNDRLRLATSMKWNSYYGFMGDISVNYIFKKK